MIEIIENELNNYQDTNTLEFNKKILNIKEGSYASNDTLLGIRTPNIRKVAKKYYKTLSLEEVLYFLRSPIHEYRLFALIVMTYNKPETVIELYLNNLKYVDNWDLVDVSAPLILGRYLFEYKINKNKENNEAFNILRKLYASEAIFERRVAIVATLYLIRKDCLLESLDFLKLTIADPSSLNNKALGWMLREVSKHDEKLLINFLTEYPCKSITFSYATERMDQKLKNSLKK